jgi:hypothetical protein
MVLQRLASIDSDGFGAEGHRWCDQSGKGGTTMKKKASGERDKSEGEYNSSFIAGASLAAKKRTSSFPRSQERVYFFAPGRPGSQLGLGNQT